MKVTETMKEVALKVGMAMAKVDTNTTCLWINYQPKEPNAVINLRQKSLRKDKLDDLS
ncbi:MAG: cyclic lactone autoinducer peptide [Aeriscardovia sp.]|nr:cyclic lactone autoinducer peptide [Butyrivibrio sp.]MBP3819723.1 cyclic lactone autoinducer peptide [Butyrivibrio sp.]MBR4414375.1 cyclic lactone autoinducer peptide [Aeriscardovia sp.]